MLNKKMLLSLLVIGVVSVTAGAGTWAYFTDTETSTDNTFTAGTLDLLVNGVNLDETMHYDESDLYPGWESSDGVAITNDGSIDGVLSMDIINLVDLENGFEEPEGADSDDPLTLGDLSENMNILIEEYDDDVGTTLLATPYNGLLSDFVPLNLGSLDDDETRYFLVTGSIATTVENEIQGDSVSFDVVLTLDQDADNNGVADA